MIEQIDTSIRFLAFYTASKQGKTGLTVTVNVRNPAGTLVVSSGAATELGDGLYSYTLAAVSVTIEGEYSAVFKTADSTVDAQHLPALWVVGRAGIEALTAGLARSAGTIVRGTAAAGATVTSVPTSTLSPAATVTDQYRGRVLIFAGDTTTAALRGQAADVTASTAGGTLTVSTLTTAPAAGDTFILV